MKVSYSKIFEEDLSKELIPQGYIFKGHMFIRYRPWSHMIQMIKLEMQYGGRDFYFELGTIPILEDINKDNIHSMFLFNSVIADGWYERRKPLNNWNGESKSTGMYDLPYDEQGFRLQLRKNVDRIIKGDVGKLLLEIDGYHDYTANYMNENAPAYGVPSYALVCCLLMSNQKEKAIDMANDLIPRFEKTILKDKEFEESLVNEEISKKRDILLADIRSYKHRHETILHNLCLLVAGKDENLKALISYDEQKSDEFLSRYLRKK